MRRRRWTRGDTRSFSFDASTAPFPALPDAAVETDRISGVLDGARYRIEIPKSTWNGKVVLYAHGYSGTGEALRITNPSIRAHLIGKG